ncbi:PX domain-containing protein EREL1-like isoform X2 [Wolffia australiana]
MAPRRSPPKHRHDGTSPLPLGMDWSPPPKRWTGRDTVWPHDPQTGWSYCVTVPTWTVQPDLGTLDDTLASPIVLKKVFPKKNIPPAPPKHSLLRINSSRLLLEERRYALEEWMDKLLSDIDLSRSVHVASFLELEAAARSSFQGTVTENFEKNLLDQPGFSTDLRIVTSSSTSMNNSVDNTDHNADEILETASRGPKMYETSTEGPESIDANEVQHDRIFGHSRKNSSESVASDISSVRGSDLHASALIDSLVDGLPEYSERESSGVPEAFRTTEPASDNDVRIVLPVDQRQKLTRILLTMQRRLITAKTDMEDLIARLNQEIAVKEYLSTKVKDLEGELESSRQKNKENLQQAILVEKERITQMQWDMDELRRMKVEMESRLSSEQKQRMLADSEKAIALSERETMVHELSSKKMELDLLRGRVEELEMKSKSDIKVLVKEVKSLRKSQADLMDKLSKSLKDKMEIESYLSKEKEKWECTKSARKNLLHECEVLRCRLEDCHVDIFGEDEDMLTITPSTLPDTLDLLETSDNRIGFLLAEAQLLGRNDEEDLVSQGDAQIKEIPRDSLAMNGEGDIRSSDGEVRRMLTDVFIDNAKLRKQVNAISRNMLKMAVRTEKEEAGASSPVRKTVLTKFLER